MAEPGASEKPQIKWIAFLVNAREGELLPLFASMAWIFSALVAYYIIKPIRSTVLQTQIGVDNKWIALLATTAFVALFVIVYGRIVASVERRKLIIATFLVFIGCLCAFAGLLPIGGAMIGYVFYVWVSTFNLMVVSQFWALSADVWTKEEGTRLFGFIGVGGVLGSIGGTLAVKWVKGLDPYQMLFLSAGLLAICLMLALYILKFGATRAAARAQAEASGSAEPKKDAPKPQGSTNPFLMVLGSPYLRLIAVMMLLLNVCNTSNEWIMDKVLSADNLDKTAVTAFYADYYLYQNVITFLVQLFVTSRVQRMFGARGALLFEPVVDIAGALAFVVAPILPVIRTHKILENSMDYSIQSNTREVLYLPTTKLEKYSAKNFNDTFVVRAGDAIAAGSIFLATTVLLPMFGPIGLKILMGLNLLLALVWVVTAMRIGRKHKELMAAMEPTAKAA